MTRPIRRALIALTAAAAGFLAPTHVAAQIATSQTYAEPTAVDQDDMCFWVHPTDRAQSTLIASDKTGGKIVVYDLTGTPLDVHDAPHPGNIDIRHGVEVGGECIDIVAFNERDTNVVHVYKVDPSTRRIVRIDDGGFATPEGNYGFTFYRHSDGRLFAYTGPESTTILRQYEVVDVGGGQVSGVQTAWSFEQSQMEGMVGDDETGYLYVGEEAAGLWKINAMDASEATLIAAVGDASGIQADVEGVTIYRAAGGAGYVIASSQGSDTFIVFDRAAPNAPIGEFQLTGVGSTDGIDVLNLAVGPFTEGIFAAHNGAACCPVQAASWGDIARSLGLTVYTSGDVRSGTCAALGTGGPTTPDGGGSGGAGSGGAAASGGAGNAGTAGAPVSAGGSGTGGGTGAAAAPGVSLDAGADPSSSDGGGSGDDSGCACHLSRRGGGTGAGSVFALGLFAALARTLSARSRRVSDSWLSTF